MTKPDVRCMLVPTSSIPDSQRHHLLGCDSRFSTDEWSFKWKVRQCCDFLWLGMPILSPAAACLWVHPSCLLRPEISVISNKQLCVVFYRLLATIYIWRTSCLQIGSDCKTLHNLISSTNLLWPNIIIIESESLCCEYWPHCTWVFIENQRDTEPQSLWLYRMDKNLSEPMTIILTSDFVGGGGGACEFY